MLYARVNESGDSFPTHSDITIGSSLHAMKALQYPKWEDYEYEYADSEDNSLYWLGDGQTWAEKSQQGDSKSRSHSL